jgi:thiamine-phosphate pyrophosphorylase
LVIGENRDAVLRRPLLVMVTDRQRLAGGHGGNSRLAPALNAVLAAVSTAARAGVDLIQLRERGLEDSDLLRVAVEAVRVTAGTRARVLVNDRLDVALAAGAEGIHLPARAFSSRQVRAIAPEGFIIGRSVHTEAEAVAAEREGGCDYLIFGSVFATPSKPAGHVPAGLDLLARVCSAVSLPVLAIGGITLDRAQVVARAGAAGVAGIGLFGSTDVRELMEIVRRLREVFGDSRQRLDARVP